LPGGTTVVVTTLHAVMLALHTSIHNLHWTHRARTRKVRLVTAPLSLAIVIVSGVLYHLAQKTAQVERPWAMLAVAYGCGFAIALVLAIADGSSAPRLARTGGSGLVLGLAALGIEVGLFYVYRSGWPLATASVISNVTVTALLATIGVIVFGEHLSGLRLVGIALALGGGVLIVRGA
jgi:drug/metabolite transporter (DMT)-like permease